MDFDGFQRRKQSKNIPRRNTFSKEVKRSISMLMVTLLSIIILLSIVFLLNRSQSFQQGIVFQEEQRKKEDLLLKNRDLVNKIIEATSFNKLEASDLVKSMMKPVSPVFLEKETQEN